MPAPPPGSEARRLLFVPQGGREGTGEYARLLTIAHAARARWPGAEISFAARTVLARFEDDPFPRFGLPDEPRGGAIERVAWATAPDVIVLNNLGKAPDLAAARRCGARLVYVGSVPHYRARALDRDLLRHMDALWIFPAQERDRHLSAEEEREWRRGGRPPIAVLDSVFAPPDSESADRERAELSVARDGYSLFVPGGGGWTPRGRPCSQLFLKAADETARRTGVPSVVVLGPLPREVPATPRGVRVLGYLPQALLMGLVRDARAVVTGGGGLLVQSLALGAACVATPLHEGDQPPRIAECAGRGFLVAAEPEPEAIAQAASALLRDDAHRAKLRARLAEAGPRNELTRCIELLAPLVEAGARPCPFWLRPVRPLRR